MATIAQQNLAAALQECAADDGTDEITDATLDTRLEDLGYDSLAVLEFTIKVKQKFGVVIPDDQATVDLTPRRIGQLIEEGRVA